MKWEIMIAVKPGHEMYLNLILLGLLLVRLNS